MIDVLIIVNTYNRDYFGAKLLNLKLSKSGIKNKIVGKYSVIQAVNRYKPFIVIVYDVTSNYIPIISSKTFIFYLSSESLSGDIELVKSIHQPVVQNITTHLKYIDVVLCWGESFFNGLSTLVDKSKLKITGSPTTDYYYHKNKGKENCIGISTTFRKIAPVSDNGSIISDLYEVFKFSGKGIFFEEENNIEDWIAFEVSGITRLIQLTESLNDNQYKIYFRPHPAENESKYKFIEDLCDNVVVSNQESLKEWLSKVGCVISITSNSLVDAYACGKKAISIRSLIPEHVYEKIPKYLRKIDSNFPTVGNIDELLKVISSKERPAIESIDRHLKKSCNYHKGGKPAYVNISNLIVDFISHNHRKEEYSHPCKVVGTKYSAYLMHDFYMLIGDKIFNRQDHSLTYMDIKFFRNRRNNHFIKSIFEDLERGL
jgi:surface carbohydrate biosynthesis protein